MNSLHATPHTARLVLGTLAALALLAAMSAAAAGTPLSSDQFAPGWQDHARPLYNVGKAQVVDRDKWYVPAILPRYCLSICSGDFNDWATEGISLTQGDDRSWSITVPLTPGTYRYKFLLDGETWENGPDADRLEDNAYGTQDSVVEVS